MPKHNCDSAHLFITQALMDRDVNLAIYKDELFKNNLRLVAIDSILTLLQQIHSHQQNAQLHNEEFSLAEAINHKHPLTRLNMLDYCLAAGFDNMALALVHHGAGSNHLGSFRHNVNTTFTEKNAPEIVHDIRTIIDGYLEIKQNYDQFVNRTNEVLPGMVSAGGRISNGYSTATLILVGIGGILLAPLIQPLIHSVTATAMFVSAGFLPAAVSGVYGATRRRSPNNPTFVQTPYAYSDDAKILEDLKGMAKDIRRGLQETLTPPHGRPKIHGPHSPQAPLLRQLIKEPKLYRHSTPEPKRHGSNNTPELRAYKSNTPELKAYGSNTSEPKRHGSSTPELRHDNNTPENKRKNTKKFMLNN